MKLINKFEVLFLNAKLNNIYLLQNEENNVVSFFWVIPWRLNFMCRSFGTL